MLNKGPQSIDGIIHAKPADTATPEPKKIRTSLARLRHALQFSRRISLSLVLKKASLLIVGAMIIGAGGVWFFFPRQLGNSGDDPFSAQLASSVQFPLYYPTRLPSGFHIDTKSTNEPRANVVVFDIDGPNNQKVYVSEEERPPSFNFGGFYKTLSSLSFSMSKNGEIATGYTNEHSESIGSLAFSSVNAWVLINSHSSVVSPAQISSMLKSLELNS
jgi:hypothetical protein